MIVCVNLVLEYVGLSCPVVACRARSEAETDVPFTISDLSTFKKQPHIARSIFVGRETDLDIS